MKCVYPPFYSRSFDHWLQPRMYTARCFFLNFSFLILFIEIFLTYIQKYADIQLVHGMDIQV